MKSCRATCGFKLPISHRKLEAVQLLTIYNIIKKLIITIKNLKHFIPPKL